MAHATRPRLVYPGLFDSEKFYRLSDRGLRCWLFLLTQADDDGFGKLHPHALAYRPHPGEPIDFSTEEAVKRQLSELQLVEFYVLDGNEYYKMHDWKDFQRVRPDRYRPSTYPQPSGNQPVTAGIPDGNQTATAGMLQGQGQGQDNDKGIAREDVTALAERLTAALNAMRKAKGQAECVYNIAVLMLISDALTKHGYNESDFLAVLRKKASLLDSEKPEVRQSFNPKHLWGQRMADWLALPDPEPEHKPRPASHKLVASDVHAERKINDDDKMRSRAALDAVRAACRGGEPDEDARAP